MRKLFFSGFIVLFILISQKLSAEDITDARIRDITNSVTRMCSVPSDRGKYWHISTTADGKAIIKLIGIGGQATFSKGEWEGIKDVLPPEGQIVNQESSRRCTQAIAPLIINKFSPTSSSQSSEGPLRFGETRSDALGADTTARNDYLFTGNSHKTVLFKIQKGEGQLPSYRLIIFGPNQFKKQMDGGTIFRGEIEKTFTPSIDGEYILRIEGAGRHGRYNLTMTEWK